MRIAVLFVATLPVLAGCGDPRLQVAKSKLLDPNGGFTLYVSNQSFAIDPVDVRVQIDGELVVSDYFSVGTQHTFVPFKLALSRGKHKIQIRSIKGEAELVRDFDPGDHDIAVITFWYYPVSSSNPVPRQFEFETRKGPLLIL